MAVNSISGSKSSSSIYGNRNIFTGMATGMDTESMIENSVAGFKSKIESLIQQQTKLTWKQDAFRGITDKLVALSQKYTSYTSKSNLTSPSFFDNSYITELAGKNKDKITAIGKSNSDVRINAVKQLASAARYSTSAANLNAGSLAGSRIDWDKKANISDMAGSMTLTYGNKAINLTFGETETVNSAEELAAKITAKLSEQNIITSSGDTVKASSRIGVNVSSDGSITFTDKAGAGNSVYISSVSGAMSRNSELSIEAGTLDNGKGRSIQVKDATKLSHQADMAEYLSGRTISVTLDGTTKNIKVGELNKDLKDADGNAVSLTDQLVSSLQSGLKDAFGDKVTVSQQDGGLSFATKYGGSTLKVSSDLGESLGLGKSGLTNFVNTGSSLGELLKGQGADKLGEKVVMKGSGRITEKKDDNGKSLGFYDENGYRVKGGDGDDKYDRLDDDGKTMMGWKLTINGVDVGTYNEDTALETVLNDINGSKAGVKVSYSQMTNKFTFTTKETGADGKIDMDSSFAKALFGDSHEQIYNEDGILTDSKGNLIVAGKTSKGKDYYLKRNSDGSYWAVNSGGNYIKENDSRIELELTDELKEQSRKGFTGGTDAILNASVNGEFMDITRSENVISLEGLNVTLKGTFNEVYNIDSGRFGVPELDEKGNYIKNDDGKIKYKQVASDDAVSFSTRADSDKITDAIKSFVDEYNEAMQAIHDAYATMPAEKNTSKHTKYEPLTEEDKEGMSDKAIEEYEKKAKQGILFGDSDLSRLYDRLRSAITPGGADRKAMEAIGLTTTYENGVTKLALDEDKLRKALDANAESVKKVFATSSTSSGTKEGLTAKIKKTLDAYGSTSYGNYGILVRRAGTTASSMSLMDNSLQKQVDSLDKQIDRWQEKMSDKIDYYTKMFSKLEQLTLQMNSQSSALLGLMSGQ